MILKSKPSQIQTNLPKPKLELQKAIQHLKKTHTKRNLTFFSIISSIQALYSILCIYRSNVYRLKDHVQIIVEPLRKGHSRLNVNFYDNTRTNSKKIRKKRTQVSKSKSSKIARCEESKYSLYLSANKKSPNPPYMSFLICS